MSYLSYPALLLSFLLLLLQCANGDETEIAPKPDDEEAIVVLESLGARLTKNEDGNVTSVGFKEPPTDEAIESLKGLPELDGIRL